MIRLKKIINDKITEGVRLDYLNSRIAELEKEWDILDPQGTGYQRQQEITKELEKLKREKEKWEKIYRQIHKSEIINEHSTELTDRENFRIPLTIYLKNNFKEYDQNQLLMFGLTIDELISSFLNKIFSIPIEINYDENDLPSGYFSPLENKIVINGVNLKKYNKVNSYNVYVFGVLFHEFIHAINYYKKLFDKITYDGIIFNDKYYGDPEEIRAYKSTIKDYLVTYLGLTRKKAENLMNKYSSDVNSSYRKKWMSKYYDINEMKSPYPKATPKDVKSGLIGAVDSYGHVTGYSEPVPNVLQIDHSELGISHVDNGRFRFFIQYPKNTVLWSEYPPQPEQKKAVEHWVNKLGYNVDNHVDYTKYSEMLIHEMKKEKTSFSKIISELEYPLAKGEDLQSYQGQEGWKGKLIWMSPDKFLNLVYPLPERFRSQNSLKNLENRMRLGLPVDFLVLAVDMNQKRIIGHEGRHRAIIAKKLGIEKVPVLIYTGHAFKRTPTWDPEDHKVVDDVDFEPEWERSKYMRS